MANVRFINSCLVYFFFKNSLDNLVNSMNDNEKIIIDINKYKILLINIKTNIKNKSNPVLIRL